MISVQDAYGLCGLLKLYVWLMVTRLYDVKNTSMEIDAKGIYITQSTKAT